MGEQDAGRSKRESVMDVEGRSYVKQFIEQETEGTQEVMMEKTKSFKIGKKVFVEAYKRVEANVGAADNPRLFEDWRVGMVGGFA
ncbi:hypothetical protein EDM53_00570 [Rickettsiales endosymbiont of Peranema trichophorum]|uniref:hypothetical protein n=1 Tax=Rickettsiales endosymbiont of Peranema trichophorum TaxID=2486577 RepID=UPI0010234CCC|nr:hypothetical protein [Rickettsiales endosymbiont of Peranema trichophorum]RZI47701.1 hypothetical protein EDM53_00570 [Rickettsiales endosymbiont of Peranema trichophorum]